MREPITESNYSDHILNIIDGVASLSYSAISQFLKSPRHFKAYKLRDEPPTKAMEEGRMFHMACLEPEKFAKEYWVLDDTDICLGIGGAKPRSTKVYKEWKQEEISKHSGNLIEKELFDTFTMMNAALRSNLSSKKYMDNLTDVEFKVEFTHDGYRIIGFLDGKGKNEDGAFSIDLKKVADAQFKRVKWDIRDMNYDMQGSIYSAATGIKRHVLIYIDKGCNITVVNLMPETLDSGFAKFEAALDAFQDCAERDMWNCSYDFWNGGYINF